MRLRRFLALISTAVMAGTCVLGNFSAVSAEDTSESGLGALEVSPSEEAAFYSQFDNADGGVDLSNISSVPASCDLSTDENSKYFPSIGDQGEINSCVAWATTYYQFTYAANKLNDIPTVGYFAYSPAWTYNYTNGGTNNGTYFTDAYNVLMHQGALRWADMPHNNTNYDYSWCTDTTKMMNALKTRVSYNGEVVINSTGTPITSNKDTDLKEVKYLLSTGHILMVTVSAASELSNWSYKPRYGNSSESVAYRASQSTYGGHAMVIVGYDDNVCCDVNGNGKIEASERGAFKIANSKGTTWKNKGFCWVLYDALNYVSANKTNNWEDSESGSRISIFERNHLGKPNNIFRYIEVKNYNVNLAGLLTVNTNNRNHLTVNLFRNPNSSTAYTNSLLYLNGNYSKPKIVASPFNGSIVFDYGEFANPASICTNGYYFGVDINNISTNNSSMNYPFTNVSYKIIDDQFNVVKNVPVSSSIANGRNSKKSVKVQCIIGDVDYDGKITTADSSILMNYTANMLDLSNLQSYLGDFNEDGVVNVADVSAINHYLLSGGNATSADIMKINEINQQVEKYLLENGYSSAEMQETLAVRAELQNLMEGDLYE